MTSHHRIKKVSLTNINATKSIFHYLHTVGQTTVRADSQGNASNYTIKKTKNQLAKASLIKVLSVLKRLPCIKIIII